MGSTTITVVDLSCLKKKMRNDTKIPLGTVLDERTSRPHPKSALLALNNGNQESSLYTIGGIFHGKLIQYLEAVCHLVTTHEDCGLVMDFCFI